MTTRSARPLALALLACACFFLAAGLAVTRAGESAGRHGGARVHERPAANDPGSMAAATPAAADSAAGPADSTRARRMPPAPLPREADPDDPLCAPLLLEGDLGFGTHVVMRRLPTVADLDELNFVTGLRQVVLALPDWPPGYAELRPLQQAILPPGVQLVVLLPGWPPTREALGAWNLVGGNLRLIMVVGGPPADRALITELNRVRALERVIVQTDYPSRSGFERLQRPVSFRVLRD